MILGSSIYQRNGRRWHHGPHNRPFDFNGDGFNDLALSREISDTLMVLDVYFGGADFDSIPDWTNYYETATRSSVGFYSTSSGYDVNGDGYQDLFLRGNQSDGERRQRIFYELFLGGEDPDTVAVFHLWDGEFQNNFNPVVMEDGYSLLPDLNDDGFAEFAAQ